MRIYVLSEKKIMYGKLKIECLLAQLHPYNLLPSMVKLIHKLNKMQYPKKFCHLIPIQT